DYKVTGVQTCALPISGVRKAGVFVRRCQNWADNCELRDSRFDDGGFFFLPDDPTRNKAGEAGTDRTGRTRFVSYGSTTADGLRRSEERRVGKEGRSRV